MSLKLAKIIGIMSRCSIIVSIGTYMFIAPLQIAFTFDVNVNSTIVLYPRAWIARVRARNLTRLNDCGVSSMRKVTTRSEARSRVASFLFSFMSDSRSALKRSSDETSVH